MTTEIKNKVTLSSSFIDEGFDGKNASANHLVLQLGTDGAALAVKDVPKNKFVGLETYAFQQTYTFDEIIPLLDVMFIESKLLAVKYKSVSCLVVNGVSTIVPSPLYEDNKKADYLKFNTTVAEQDILMTDDFKNLDAKNVYAISGVLKNRLSKNFASVNYYHFSSVLIDNVLAQTKNQANKKLFVSIYPSSFQVILAEGKSLLFYNTFHYRTVEDFMYYLLFVCEQLQLNPENIETTFIGEIEKTSAYYTMAYKYIRNIKFGERNDSTDYAYQLQTLPKHFYFNLFSGYAN